jgi:hypothetical protein
MKEIMKKDSEERDWIKLSPDMVHVGMSVKVLGVISGRWRSRKITNENIRRSKELAAKGRIRITTEEFDKFHGDKSGTESSDGGDSRWEAVTAKDVRVGDRIQALVRPTLRSKHENKEWVDAEVIRICGSRENLVEMNVLSGPREGRKIKVFDEYRKKHQLRRIKIEEAREPDSGEHITAYAQYVVDLANKYRRPFEKMFGGTPIRAEPDMSTQDVVDDWCMKRREIQQASADDSWVLLQPEQIREGMKVQACYRDWYDEVASLKGKGYLELAKEGRLRCRQSELDRFEQESPTPHTETVSNVDPDPKFVETLKVEHDEIGINGDGLTIPERAAVEEQRLGLHFREGAPKKGHCTFFDAKNGGWCGRSTGCIHGREFWKEDE